MDNTITIANIARDVVPSITTLLAAFLGAWFAYKLEDNSKQREIRKIKVIDYVLAPILGWCHGLNHL
jgi:hypothetical protein